VLNAGRGLGSALLAGSSCRETVGPGIFALARAFVDRTSGRVLGACYRGSRFLDDLGGPPGVGSSGVLVSPADSARREASRGFVTFTVSPEPVGHPSRWLRPTVFPRFHRQIGGRPGLGWRCNGRRRLLMGRRVGTWTQPMALQVLIVSGLIGFGISRLAFRGIRRVGAGPSPFNTTCSCGDRAATGGISFFFFSGFLRSQINTGVVGDAAGGIWAARGRTRASGLVGRQRRGTPGKPPPPRTSAGSPPGRRGLARSVRQPVGRRAPGKRVQGPGST